MVANCIPARKLIRREWMPRAHRLFSVTQLHYRWNSECRYLPVLKLRRVLQNRARSETQLHAVPLPVRRMSVSEQRRQICGMRVEIFSIIFALVFCGAPPPPLSKFLAWPLSGMIVELRRSFRLVWTETWQCWNLEKCLLFVISEL